MLIQPIWIIYKLWNVARSDKDKMQVKCTSVCLCEVCCCRGPLPAAWGWSHLQPSCPSSWWRQCPPLSPPRGCYTGGTGSSQRSSPLKAHPQRTRPCHSETRWPAWRTSGLAPTKGPEECGVLYLSPWQPHQQRIYYLRFLGELSFSLSFFI